MGDFGLRVPGPWHFFRAKGTHRACQGVRLGWSLLVTGCLSLSLSACIGTVEVRGPGDSSGSNSTLPPAPKITQVVPNFGNWSAPKDIIVSGSGFRGPFTVKVGSKTCLNAILVSESQITCTVPANNQPAAADVTVTNPDRQVGALTGGYQWRDITPPTISITGQPPALIRQTSVTFNFVANDDYLANQLLFECQLDRESFRDCPSKSPNGAGWSFSYSGLTDGNHLLQIRAIDAAGNRQDSAVVYWTIDTLPPGVAITSPATGSFVNSANKMNLEVSGTCSTGDGSVIFRFGNTPVGSAVACSSGNFSTFLDLRAISDGSGIALVASQTDAAGNTGTASVSLNKDTLAPSLTVTQTDQSTNTNSVTFSGSCESGLSVRIGGAVSTSVSCPSGSWSYTPTASTDGARTYQFSQIDAAGNESSPQTRTWSRSTTLPTVAITAPVANTSVQSGVTLAVLCSPGVTLGFSGDVQSAPSPITCPAGGTISQSLSFSGGEGSKTVTVTGVDTYGNQQTDSKIYVRDQTPPASISLAGSLSSPSRDTSQRSIYFSGSDVNSYKAVVIRSGSCATATYPSSGVGVATPFQFTPNTEGTYIVCALGGDSAGNWQTAGTAVATLSIDTTAPIMALTSPSAGSYVNTNNQTSLSVSGTCSSDDGTVSFKFGGTPVGVPVACSSGNFSTSLDLRSILDGSGIALVASQTDAAGNSGAASISLNKSTVDPTIVGLRVTPSPIASNRSPIVSGTTTAGATVDLFNNSSDCSGSIIGTANADSSGSFGLSPTSTLSNDGLYTFSVKSTTLAGNSTCSTGAVSYTLDTTSPTISISQPNSDGSYLAGGQTLTVMWGANDVNFVDAPFSLHYRVDAGSWTLIAGSIDKLSTSSSWTTPSNVSGAVQLRVTAQDLAGNTSYSYRNLTLISGSPTVTGSIVENRSAFQPGETIHLNWSVADNSDYLATGPVRIEGKWVNAIPAPSFSPIVSGLSSSGSNRAITLPTPDGTTGFQYQIRIVATDKAGNEGYRALSEITIDGTPPSLLVSRPEPSRWYAASIPVRWLASPHVSQLDPIVIKLEYSADDGVTWNRLEQRLSNARSYSWDISKYNPGKQYQLKVTATDVAGNSQSVTSNSLYINNNSPSLTISGLDSENKVITTTNTYTFSGNCDLLADTLVRVTLPNGTNDNTACSLGGSWSYPVSWTGEDDLRSYLFSQSNAQTTSVTGRWGRNSVTVNSISPSWVDFSSPTSLSLMGSGFSAAPLTQIKFSLDPAGASVFGCVSQELNQTNTQITCQFDPQGTTSTRVYVFTQVNGLKVSTGLTLDVGGIFGQSDANSVPQLAGGLNLPAGIAVLGNELWVTDLFSNRVQKWDLSQDMRQNPAALDVLGARDLYTLPQGLASVGPDRLNAPAGIALSSGGLKAVADLANHRVLLYPSGSSSPSVVLGQDNFNSGTPNRGAESPNASSLLTPAAAVFADTKLIVSDTGNHRVLIWNSIPTSNGAPADVVLGQGDFVSQNPNTDCTGTLDNVSACSLNAPIGVIVVQGKLVVSDSGNNRILIWDSIPTRNHAAANRVLGQMDLNTGNSGLSSAALNNPAFLAFRFDGGTGWLIASDTGNHRVLIWNEPFLGNGLPASFVLGQSDFDSGSANHGAAGPDASTLNSPFGIAVSSSGQIFVADAVSRRVLGWNSYPTVNGQSADFVLGQANFNLALENQRLVDDSQVGDVSDFTTNITADSVPDWPIMYFVSPNLNRIGVYTYPPAGAFPTQISGPIAPTGYLGQPNGYSALPNQGESVSASSFNHPTAAKVVITTDPEGSPHNYLVVSDAGNHRVLIWDGLPLTLSTPPSIVLGQPDFTSNAINLGSTGFYAPGKIEWLSGSQQLLVTDTGNNRILVWNGMPTINQQAADFVIGQTDLSSNGTDQLEHPLAVSVTPSGQGIWVADSGHDRLLGWNLYGNPLTPSSDGSILSFVQNNGYWFGQLSLANIIPGQTAGPSSSRLWNPSSINFSDSHLYVADQLNHRVLSWRQDRLPSPTQIGQPIDVPDGVIGQIDFNHNVPNSLFTSGPDGPSFQSLQSPTSTAVFYPGDGRKLLLIMDSGNRRVVIKPVD